jgi:hypothetical protein
MADARLNTRLLANERVHGPMLDLSPDAAGWLLALVLALIVIGTVVWIGARLSR